MESLPRWLGRLLGYGELSFEKHGDTGLKVIQLFSPRTKEQGTVLKSARPSSEIFSCSESGCVLTFKTEAEADAHMDSGKHVRELESESLYDSIRKKWAEKVTGMNVPSRDHDSGPVHYNQPPSSLSISRQSIGWTLKTTKKSSRMEDHVKNYLMQKFDAETRSRLKVDPAQESFTCRVFMLDVSVHIINH